MARLKIGDHVGWKNENKSFGTVLQFLIDGQNAVGPFTPRNPGVLVKFYQGKISEIHARRLVIYKKKTV